MQPLEPGRFPFGVPNRVVRASGPDDPDALLVGAYPSAFHLSWRAPREHGAVAFGGLAVDTEPGSFWPGEADPRERDRLVEYWRRRARLQTASVPGTFGWCGANGSTGRMLDDLGYFHGIGTTRERTACTDSLPVFTVKRGSGGRREQGDAIDDYNAIAEQLGLPVAQLPERPPPAELPTLAAAAYGDLLREDLLRLQPPLVVTVGQEAWETLARVATVDPPGADLRALREAERYGASGDVRLEDWTAAWLPLAHPALLRQDQTWRSAHIAWMRSVT